MVSVATVGSGDPGSNPGWFAVSNPNENGVINTRIIQASNGAKPIVVTVTVSSLEGGDK